METIIAASKNAHKIAEIEAITAKHGLRVISRDEAGVPPFEVEEDGDTFEANSLKKAAAIFEVTGKMTIADDSGLMVDYLDGAPGIYSARFGGEEADDAKNNAKLLALMEGVPYEERTATFVSVITMLFPEGEPIVARGEVKGHLLTAPRGENGFGYDPLFVPVGYDRTFAEMGAEEKNGISHRARALEELDRQLQERRR